MTTVIACMKTKTMASDSMMSHQDTKYDGEKTFKSKDGKSIVGIAGDVDFCYTLKDWYLSGCKKSGKPVFTESESNAGQIIILEEDGIYLMGSKLIKMKVNSPFYAIGSGTHAALAAMHMGASIEKAVEIAAKIDVNSGLPVQIMKLGEEHEKTTIANFPWPLDVPELQPISNGSTKTTRARKTTRKSAKSTN